ncbi:MULTISPECIES: hypothetical protein [Halobellus]|uniref:hypothetical protein n=1 Tax=Halobellus TaxID=1073986 RepID=UPI002109F85F|nr:MULTISPECIES: hypothetical protein [Halobellus]MDQ2054084.1 hypothetical protein [Halobellus sp. H-GB7]
MNDETVAKVRRAVECAIEDTDDREVRFALRQAAQLLLAVEERADDELGPRQTAGPV